MPGTETQKIWRARFRKRPSLLGSAALGKSLDLSAGVSLSIEWGEWLLLSLPPRVAACIRQAWCAVQHPQAKSSRTLSTPAATGMLLFCIIGPLVSFPPGIAGLVPIPNSTVLV